MNTMQGVLKNLVNPHLRVRYAGCNAIGQMATDLAAVFEKKFQHVAEDPHRGRFAGRLSAGVVSDFGLGLYLQNLGQKV